MPEDNVNRPISHVLETLEAALRRGDTAAAVELFQPNCYWRDLVAFTWNIKTMEGREQIAAMGEAKWRTEQAAQALGMSRATLYRRIAKLHILPPHKC